MRKLSWTFSPLFFMSWAKSHDRARDHGPGIDFFFFGFSQPRIRMEKRTGRRVLRPLETL